MTTLLHLAQSISDIQNELSREQRFSGDARRNLLNGIKIIREAVDTLERDIAANFEERDRAVARMIGNSQPFTTVIDSVPAHKKPDAPEMVDDEAQEAEEGGKNV